MSENPLVVAPETGSAGPGPLTSGTGDNGWATGIGIVESAMDAYNGLSEGNWVAGGLGAVGIAAEAVSTAVDPIGTLLSYGVSWLMEHVQPLQDALDKIAGDPPAIEAYGKTWAKVSEAVGTAATDYRNAVKTDTATWKGKAGAAYQDYAAKKGEALGSASTLASGIGTVVTIMGEVVAFVREFVRDLIADCISRLISYALEAVFSLGLATPLIVTQAVSLISEYVTKIADIFRKLVRTISDVSPKLGKLTEVFGKIVEFLADGGGGVADNVAEGFWKKTDDVLGTNVVGKHRAKFDDGPDGGSGEDGPDSDGGSGSDGGTPDSDGGAGGSDSRPGSGDSGGGPGDTTANSDAPAPSGTRPGGSGGDSSTSSSDGADGAPSPSGGGPTGSTDGGGPSPTSSSPGDRSSPAGSNGPTSPSPTGDPTGPNGSPSGSDTFRADSEGSTGASSDPPSGDSGPTVRSDGTPSSSSSPSAESPSGGSGSPASGTPSSSNNPEGGTSPSGGSSGPTSGSPGSTGGSSAPDGSDGAPSSPQRGNSDPSGSSPSSNTPASTSTSGTVAPPRSPDAGTPRPTMSTTGARPDQPMTGTSGPTGTTGTAGPSGNPSGGSSGGSSGGGGKRPGSGGGWTGTPGSPGSTSRTDAPEGGSRRPDTSSKPERPAMRGQLRTDAPSRSGTPETHQRPPGSQAPTTPDTTRPASTGPGQRTGAPDPQRSKDGPDGRNSADADPGTPQRQQRIEEAETHRDSTPAGSSYHDDPNMRDLARRVPDDGVHHTVDAHALPDGRVRIGDHTLSAEEFADMLRRDPDWDGKPIRLLSCDAGDSGLARRLSDELGVPVTSPRGVAWTDGNGNVFSSSVGPDGQPGWPPDGGWDTHHPDGTKSSVSEDGFHPPRDGDGPGERPEDAEARGHPPRGSSVGVETPESPNYKEKLEERIQDPEYRERYYDGPDVNGKYSRRSIEQLDHTGEQIPQIIEHRNTTTDANGEEVTTSTFRIPEEDIKVFADPDFLGHRSPADTEKEEFRHIVQNRESELRNLHETKEAYRPHDPKNTKDFPDETDTEKAERINTPEAKEAHEARSDAYRDLTKTSENLGEAAGRNALEREYGISGEQLDAIDSTRKSNGNHCFDLIGQAPDGTWVVVEAKAPDAGLGKRQGPNGYYVQQGTREYFESIIHEMNKRGETDLARQLNDALDDGELEYLEVRAKVQTEGTDGRPIKHEYDGYEMSRFNLAD